MKNLIIGLIISGMLLGLSLILLSAYKDRLEWNVKIAEVELKLAALEITKDSNKDLLEEELQQLRLDLYRVQVILGVDK